MTNAKKPNRANATTAEQKRLRRCVRRAAASIAATSTSSADVLKLIEPLLEIPLIDQLEFRLTPPKQEQVPDGDPTPEEVAKMMEEIRSGWTSTIEAKRRYNAEDDRRYDIPIVDSMGFDCGFKDEIW